LRERLRLLVEREPVLLLRPDDAEPLLPFRDEDDREPDELLRERDDEDEPLPLRDDALRDDEPLPLRADALRDDDEPLPEDDDRDEDERDDEPPLRLRELERRDDVRRSAAGISSWATAFVSCGISFSRNFAIRSSSRLMPRAIFAVSLSPTRSASASIAV
jgi:hypothetical protein